MQKFPNVPRRSIDDAPTVTVSKRPIQSYLDGQIDDERMFTLDYPFDKAELTNIYRELLDDQGSQGWPWTDPDKEDGWHRAGWYYPEINNLIDNIEQPHLTIDRYSYLKELCKNFSFKNSAVWYFRNKSWFAYPIHYDSAIAPSGQAYASFRKKPPGERFKNFPESYYKDKMLGSRCSLNVLLCREWAGDETPVPIEFTYENQAYLSEGDVKGQHIDYYKTDMDWRYYYQVALLNTNWTHYVTMNGEHERLMFRWSIYGQTFEETKNQLKSMGL